MRPLRIAAISSWARPISDKAERARRISTWPYQVGSTPRAWRSNNGTPRIPSISAKSLEAAGWVMLAASAARSTDRCSYRCSNSNRCRVLSREALNQLVEGWTMAVSGSAFSKLYARGIAYDENFICRT